MLDDAQQSAPLHVQGYRGTVTVAWISEAWRLYVAHWPEWGFGMLAAVLVGFFAWLAFSLSFRFGPPPTNGPAGDTFLRIALSALIWVIVCIIGGLLKMATQCLRGEPVNFLNVFSGFSKTLPIVGLSLILAAIVGLTFIVLLASAWNLVGAIMVIPIAIAALVLVIASTILYLSALILIMDGVSLANSMTRCKDGIAPVLVPTILVYLAFTVVLLVSCIPLFLGLFATLPMLFLLVAITFRERSGLYVQGYPLQVADAEPPVPGVWPPPPTVGG